MEADWEFQIGGDAPVIEAYWTGLVDLRARPERVAELSECRQLPGLADVLVRLNGADSPVWTSKTDVFTPEHIDPGEIGASAEDAVCGIACYIDLLWRDDRAWINPEASEEASRHICEGLLAIELSRCRVDVVVRKALIAEVEKLGATIYFSACGPSIQQATARLSECLNAFTEFVVARL